MKKKLCFLAFLFAMNFTTSRPQTISMRPPEIIPVSPEAADVQRYVSYPVDYSTGIPYIRIPLYEIKVGDIVLPITLSYHSAGLKPKEPSGRVGTGWTLNAEPSVMRSIRGLADNSNSLALSGDKTLTNKVCQDLLNGTLDGEPDLYSYSLNPGSGSFYKATYSPFYISYPRNNDKMKINNDLITITTGDGIVYHFGDGANAKEKTEQLGFNSQITRWLCNRITSLKTNAEITFSYRKGESTSIDYYYNMHDSRVVDQSKSGLYNWFSDTGAGFIYLLSLIENDEKKEIKKGYYSGGKKYGGRGLLVQRSNLDVISFNGYKIHFYHDLYHSNYYISDMIVTDTGDNQIYRVQFFTNQYNKNTELIKLDSIQVSAPNCEIQTYRFDYHEKTSVPNNETRGIDHWGFYNGSNGNECGVPTIHTKLEFSNGVEMTYPYTIIGADREPNAAYTRCGVLKKIVNPKGAVTEFEYEGNAGAFLMDYRGTTDYEKYAYYAHPVGGLRIAKISESTKNKQITIKSYKYGLEPDISNAEGPIMGGGVIKHIVTNRDYCFESWRKWNYGDMRYVKTWQAMPISNITFNNGSAVVYTFVQEDIEDQKTGTTITSKYYYNMPPHGYDKVLAYDNFHYPTKIATDYWNLVEKLDNPAYSNQRILRKEINRPYDVIDAFNQSNDWKYGHLIKKEHYKKDTLVSSVSYAYDYKLREGASTSEVYIYKPYCSEEYLADPTQEYNHLDPNAWPVMTGDPNYPENKIENSKYIIGSWQLDAFHWKALERESNKQYFYTNGVTNIVTTEKRYRYDDHRHTNPTGVTNENFNQTIEDKYAYHETMVNTLSYHKKITNNSNIESEIVFDENRPQRIRYKTGNMEDFDDKIIYDRYDHYGNIAEISTNEGKHTCYIWGYSNQHPIAEINNVTYPELLQAMGKNEVWIKELGNKHQPSEQDMNLLNSLRDQLPTAQVNTFTYQPLAGVASITNPYDFTTYYEYDRFGRLIETYLIEDGNKKVIQKIGYHINNSKTINNMAVSPPICEFSITDIITIDPGTNTVMERQDGLLILNKNKNYIFKVMMEGGSGSFKYEWNLLYPNDTNIYGQVTTSTNQVTFMTQYPPGNLSPKINKIKVKVRDEVTYSEKEYLRYFYVYDY